MNYIDELIQNCNLAKKAVPSNEFVFDDLDSFDIDDLSKIDTVKKAVYVIEEISGDKNETYFDFSIYKGAKERSCSKLNSPSDVLYVGSSTTKLKKRIKEHLGDGHPRTYALHLKHWFRGKYKISIKEYNESDEVIQIIEDDLSDRLGPAFGKKGGNNR